MTATASMEMAGRRGELRRQGGEEWAAAVGKECSTAAAYLCVGRHAAAAEHES